MSVLDALTILGSGVGRGYRGSQELQRRLGEEKRKALLEEREAIINERNAESQRMLAEAQKNQLIADTTLKNFTREEAAKKAARQTTSVTPGGAPLRAQVLGQDVSLPGTLESLTDQGDLIRQLEDQGFKDQHPGFYTNYPPAGTAAAAIKNSPEARGRAYIEQILTGNPPISLGEDPTEYTARTTTMMQAKLNFLRSIDPEALDELFGTSKSAGRDTTKNKDPNTKSRFNVIVK